jgi:hypothetical protein
VLVNGYLAADSEPLIDWEPLRGGPLVGPNGRYRQMSRGGVIELVTEGVAVGFESAEWNIGNALWSDPAAKADFLDSRGRHVRA